MSRVLRLALPCDGTAAGRLAGALEAFFDAQDLPPAMLPGFAIAFDEVVTNIVSHAHPGGGAGHEMLVELRAEAGELHGEVSDDGIAFDPLSLPEPDITLDVEARAIGGLGVLLLRRLMDRVSYERRGGRNHLRFAKALPPE